MDLFADGVKKNRCPCSQAWFICLGDSWTGAKVHVESYDYLLETWELVSWVLMWWLTLNLEHMKLSKFLASQTKEMEKLYTAPHPREL